MTEEAGVYNAGIRPFTLSQLNSAIQEALELTFPHTLWVIAEISEARCNARGHCYLALVEKEEDKVIAHIKANIWSNAYRSLSQKFERATGERLKAGMQVLLSVDVTFHEVYGLSLNINDIDPTYSLGEMARKKKETIERLRDEGLIDLNKSRALPLVTQRIAIISSSTAAGYGDFVDHLDNNPYGYKIYHDLYQSTVQGQEAEASIIVSLSRIKEKIKKYDAVVIIRGGGAQLDLSCFDGYSLAAEIAKCPLPVITGIGHERDDTVADMVAHTKLKTPTAVAEFLLGGMRDFEDRLSSLKRQMTDMTKDKLKDEGHRLRLLTQDLSHILTKRFHEEHKRLFSAIHGVRHGTGAAIGNGQTMIKLNLTKIMAGVKSSLQSQENRLLHLGQAVRLLDPINILQRGYSITYHRNKAIKDSEGIKQGDIIVTKLYNGSIKSSVEDKNGG